MFSAREWIYPKLPDVGSPWTPEWPENFTVLPRSCFRLADDSTGVVTTEGEGSALVSIYTDTWHKTPEEREATFSLLKETLVPLGLTRGMTRQIGEIRPDGQIAYRLTILWRGEFDHANGRMCRA